MNDWKPQPVADVAISGSIFLIDFWLNQKYGVRNLPLFHDDAFIFDAGWKLVSGQIPFVDFYPITLPIVLLQALTFLLFGTIAASLVIHASIFNGLFGVVA